MTKKIVFMPQKTGTLTHELEFMPGSLLTMKKYLTVDEARSVDFNKDDGFKSGVDMVVKSIVDWNLHDDEGNKHPITYDIVKHFPLSELKKLIQIVKEGNGIKTPEEEGKEQTKT